MIFTNSSNANNNILPDISVFVPCYNYGHFLPDCIESVVTQDGVSVEVLIIDDASSDNSAETAAEIERNNSRVKLLRHTTNQGHIATYNEGIEWASARYLLLLSADDYLLPGALHRAITLMDRFPEVGFTYGKALEFHDKGETKKRDIVIPKNIKTNWRVLEGLKFIELAGGCNIVCTPTAIVRTELQKRLGGYRSELPHTGDMEMWLRLAAHGSVGIIEDFQAVYRRHGDNMSDAYITKSWLPDLKERQSAINYFLQTCSPVLPNVNEIHRKMCWSLGCDAIGFASTAFNMNEIEDSERLLDFAFSVSPRVKFSWQRIRLFLKKLLGLKIWGIVQSIKDSVKRG